MDSLNVLKHLNELLTYLHDSRDDYREYSSIVPDRSAQIFFNAVAKQRESMIRVLEALIKGRGKDPVKHGSLSGVLHRIFVNVKNTVSKYNVDMSLREISKGENGMIKRYNEVLRKDRLSPEMQQILVGQLDVIRSNILDAAKLTAKPNI